MSVQVIAAEVVTAAFKVGDLIVTSAHKGQLSLLFSASRRGDFATSRSEPLSLVSGFGLDPGLYSLLTVAGRDIRSLRPAL